MSPPLPPLTLARSADALRQLEARSVAAMLGRYPAVAGRYDELLAAGGAPRPHWERFLVSLAQREPREVADTFAQLEREIRENGITYNVYADPQGADRPWEVDPLPHLIPADEWREIEAGIEQRADLLNRVLADLYGPQELLRSGAIAAPAVFGHSGFLHPVQGIKPPGGVHLFFYAADLGRSPDGRWWVVADRTQAPSGAGYALENRLVVSRVFPEMFRELEVQHLAAFFATVRESLLAWAPKPDPGEGAPLIALLTPGPYNETYFEHALLARYLGFALVEGSDLTVRNGRVWMKSVEGLKRVHVLLRRQDDEYCDPLELRSDSALGVAGLVDCARRGTVMIANSLGSGVIESGALLGYLPAVCQKLLGEPLKLPSVATWWLGEPAAFDDAWRQLDRLLIKPIDRATRGGIRAPAVFGSDLSSAHRQAWRQRVGLHPGRYVAQEWVKLSQIPVIDRRSGLFGARAVGLRVFAVATPQGWRVMPGGLSRVAGDGDARVIAMQRGGRSKDTWVLADAPVNAAFSLLSTKVQPQDLVSGGSSLPSRAAENLFWFGRYAERCDHSARLLRVAVQAVLDDSGEGIGNLVPLAELVRHYGLVDDPRNLGAELLHAASHSGARLASDLRQLGRVAFNLRDRMSNDNWRSLNTLIGDGASGSTITTLPAALAWLDRTINQMMTLSGFMLDGMTRSTGWRFLSIGRRLERLINLCTVLQVAIGEGRQSGLDWLLDLADSGVTYRGRYPVAPEWLPVLHLLICDETNPRAVAFQVKGLVDFIAKLESRFGRFGSEPLTTGLRALDGLGTHDLDPDSPRLAQVLAELRSAGMTLSDDLSSKFFSLAPPRSVLSMAA
jgi:uncharacterized circularly permuted ATP-grasp superfamily protein/uncharacterized alpha-E superfamily protein